MERPKGIVQPVVSEDTSEVMYLDEAYDCKIDELSARCTALAEELLTLKEPGSPSMLEYIVVRRTPQEVIEKLKHIRVGEVLAGDDEQLAIQSDDYYPKLDIKKQDMTLADVSLCVVGSMYPFDERMKWYSLELSFSYDHPEIGIVDETVTLSIGQCGELSMYRQIAASPYAEAGYEGHAEKGLNDITGEDIAAFVDLIAEIVGDEPMAMRQRNDRELAAYSDTVPSEIARMYLREWRANMGAFRILRDLQNTAVGGESLAYALKHNELAEQGLETLAAKVDDHRARRNELAADKKRSMEWFGYETMPWRDLIDRQAQS